MKRCALITVSDKTGVEALAKELATLGFTIISTAGTANFLRSHGLQIVEVEELTGFPEILDGRVKTLHPAIHAGILADRGKAEHLQTLAEKGISRIDLVAVNLYPFSQTISRENVTEEEAIENIDIGGPALIRAAAKNHRGVIVLTDPADYPSVLDTLREQGDIGLEQRRELARKAFALVSGYDARIAIYFASKAQKPLPEGVMPPSYNLGGQLIQPLRYGENPHQAGGFYASGVFGWKVLHGKEMSFNNIQDTDAALRALRLFEQPTAVIVKHCNPCGIACAGSLAEAYVKAFAADPLSPFGGIVAFNRPLDLDTAQQVNKIFTEIVIAPDFEAGVVDFLRKKKNRRLVCYDPGITAQPDAPWELKQLQRGFLLQTWDPLADDPTSWKIVTRRQPTREELAAMQFAWKAVSLLRSNAIALTGADCVFGLGSGQTSRIDSTLLAIQKAQKFGHDLSAAVCASDGYFPMTDSVAELHKCGVQAVVQPGGSQADAEVTAACDEYGMAMVHTGFRHFRH